MPTSATSVSGAQSLVDALEQLGVELVWGLPGVHNLAIWKALRESPIRLVGVRHEQTAVYAADGYARATGRLGVALVTTGPGAANTLAATGEAMAASSPVLVIATDVATALRRPGIYRGTLHETRDQAAMFRPVTKAARTLERAGEIRRAVAELAALALAPSSGTAYLGVPTDLLASPAGDGGPSRTAVASETGTPQLLADPLSRAQSLLAGAERPFIWAGGGALRSGAGDLVGELALKLAAPVVTTYMGRGLLPPDHPCAAPGPVHAREIGELWDAADVVLAVGSDLDGMMTQNWLMPQPPTLIAINVDEADANKNYACDVTLVGDARAVLAELVPMVPERGGLPQLQERLGAIAAAVSASLDADEPQARALLDSMERALPEDTVVVVDMCIPGYWLSAFRRVPLPRKLAYPMGWGTLGFGFPASLGAALAGTGPAVCVTGDGGFLYACGELATIVEANIPVTVVLVDDGGYGMLRFDQAQAGEEPFGVDLVRPDFEALARSFGVRAVTIEGGFGAQFEDALRYSIASPEASMIVVTASLKPPPTTSPRWYRRLDAAAGP